MKPIFYTITTILVLCIGCTSPQTDVHKQSAYNESGHIQAIIEIPAGTNQKIEYSADEQAFVQDSLNGHARVINFLPYPGNYGFIPSTLMEKARGGDGDPLDVLVIGESVPTGTRMSILPIGALMLKDRGEIDTKIIAVPADSRQQIITAKSFESFLIEYNAAQHIVQEWFMNYKGLGQMELIGWKDEQYALSEIKKWAKE